MIGFNKCKLMTRRHESGEWAEFQGIVTLAIQNGICLTFRDTETSSILCDVHPKAALKSIELVDSKENRIFKIELKKESSDVLSCVAFQVEDVSIDDCVAVLQENGFHLNNCTYVQESSFTTAS